MCLCCAYVTELKESGGATLVSTGHDVARMYGEFVARMYGGILPHPNE